MKTVTLSAMLLMATPVLAQVSFNMDTYNPNDAVVEQIFDSNVLPAGVTFDLTVSGTYSIWANSHWSAPCGAPEAAPQIPSSGTSNTGTVGFDMEYIFALPNAGSCSGATLPQQTSRIEISVDGGTNWFHPTTSTAYNTGHVYTYSVTGQGFPLGVRHVSALNSDDYGELRFTLTQNPFICDDSFDFETYNTNDSQVEELYSSQPLVLGASYSMDVTGTYSIWRPSHWSAPCGAPEAAPQIPSTATTTTGTVGFDMEYIFALPNAGSCSGATLPLQTNRIEISVDNGATWFHPTTSTAYNSSHLYNYTVVGQGYPLGVRHISALNSDDYGMLRFTLSTACPRLATAQPAPLAALSGVKVFPNPAQDELFITTGEATQQNTRIFNLMGQQQRVRLSGQGSSQVTVDVSDLAPGVYLVLFEAEGKTISRKVMVN